MGVNMWNVVSMQEREIHSIQQLRRLRLIKRSANVTFFLAYFRVSNALLKTVMKAHAHSLSLLRKYTK